MMQFSPKLKKAMEEIKEILAKHDIGAVVVLHDVGNTEYLIKIDPSYSCAKFEGENVRFKSKLVDFGGDKKAQEKQLASTANMIRLLADNTGQLGYSLLDLADTFDNQFGAIHGETGHTSIITQNN